MKKSLFTFLIILFLFSCNEKSLDKVYKIQENGLTISVRLTGYDDKKIYAKITVQNSSDQACEFSNQKLKLKYKDDSYQFYTDSVASQINDYQAQTLDAGKQIQYKAYFIYSINNSLLDGLEQDLYGIVYEADKKE